MARSLTLQSRETEQLIQCRRALTGLVQRSRECSEGAIGHDQVPALIKHGPRAFLSRIEQERGDGLAGRCRSLANDRILLIRDTDVDTVGTDTAGHCPDSVLTRVGRIPIKSHDQKPCS
jgi:hypothetical protein